LNNYSCSGFTYQYLSHYLQHLKTHQKNAEFFVNCIVCGQTCSNWDAFRKHNQRIHKDENSLDLFNNYSYVTENISFDDPIIEESVINEASHETDNEDINYKSEEDEINDLEETQIRYSQYLLEMTFQQKLSSKTVDTLNYHTKRLFDSSLMVFKVFFILVFKILKFYFDMF
jgi:hypothetical protein